VSRARFVEAFLKRCEIWSKTHVSNTVASAKHEH